MQFPLFYVKLFLCHYLQKNFILIAEREVLSVQFKEQKNIYIIGTVSALLNFKIYINFK